MLDILKLNGNNIEKGLLGEKDVWISMTNPTDEEINSVISAYNVEEDSIRASLDPEEVSRLEVEDDEVLVLVNAPTKEGLDEQLKYFTIPIGIIVKDEVIITVTLKEISFIERMKTSGKFKANINKHTKFVFELNYNVAIEYLRYLRNIDKLTNSIENELIKNTKKEYFIQLLNLERNLVYFLTALKSNEQVLNRIIRFKALNIFEEDEDLFEDVQIEIKQAQEMATINSKVIRSIRDAFSSIVSNNLNKVMKTLASFTIILTIPTMIFSFFGMNTYLGKYSNTWVYTFLILAVSLIVSTVLYKIMKSKNMF